MKSGLKILFGLTIVLGFMIGVAHADTSTPVLQMPGWIVGAIKDLENIPAIGHVITLILGVIAVVSMILTPLSSLLMALEKATGWAELDKINAFLNKIIPYVAMFSNLNVQAPTATTPASTVVVTPVVAATAVASTPSTPQ